MIVKNYQDFFIFIKWNFAIYFTNSVKPAIHLLSDWRECEKMLAKWETWEVYRWHFVNWLAIIFLISRFAVLAWRSVFSQSVKQEHCSCICQVSRRIEDEQNQRYCEKCIVIRSQSHEIVHEIVHEHVEMRETISV